MTALRFQTRGSGHQTDLASLRRKGRGGRGVVRLEEMEGQHGKCIHHRASLPPHPISPRASFTHPHIPFLFHAYSHIISLSHIHIISLSHFHSHNFSFTYTHTLYLFHTSLTQFLFHTAIHIISLSHIHTISLTCTITSFTHPLYFSFTHLHFLFHTSTPFLFHTSTHSFRCVHVHIHAQDNHVANMLTKPEPMKNCEDYHWRELP